VDDTLLLDSLARFKRLFETKATEPSWHPSEEGVRECLATGLLEGLRVPTEALVYERLENNHQRTDLWIEGVRIALELKFHRPIQSGHTRPLTQQFGALLADCRKLASIDARDRLLVLVTDSVGFTHLANKALLPVNTVGRDRIVTDMDIESLPATASRNVLYAGPWLPLTASLVWRESGPLWRFLAWRIVPEAP
jgi:hypothetical protein